MGTSNKVSQKTACFYNISTLYSTIVYSGPIMLLIFFPEIVQSIMAHKKCNGPGPIAKLKQKQPCKNIWETVKNANLMSLQVPRRKWCGNQGEDAASNWALVAVLDGHQKHQCTTELLTNVTSTWMKPQKEICSEIHISTV